MFLFFTNPLFFCISFVLNYFTYYPVFSSRYSLFFDKVVCDNFCLILNKMVYNPQNEVVCNSA
jgi:hypothetical protein